MKDINNYILEKFKISKDIKEPKQRKASEADYYICYLEKDKKTLHCKWIGTYTKNEQGRKEAEERSERYSNFGQYKTWKRIPGVKTRLQVNTVASHKDVINLEWY